MSGIAGIYQRDGRRVEVSHPSSALGASRGWGFEISGNEDGSVIVTLDGRFDNREELRDALGARGARLRQDCDGELLLRAYECWGEECPAKLLGDFAFAIWDGRERRVFCARDHVGVRPFYYHLSPKSFAFASAIRDLLAMGEIPRRLNESRVADYFTDELAPVDQEATFYQDILRLPAGHSLTVTADRVTVRDYWQLGRRPLLKLGSWEEYGEAFREVFVEAVRCRLRSAGRTGATLSGGLDSSSIVCTVRELIGDELNEPLHTVSLVDGDETKCGETPYIREVLCGGGLAPKFVRSDQAGDYCGELEQVIAESDEPWDIGHYAFNHIVVQAARKAGLDVLLEGAAGDAIVPPVSFLATLLRRLKLGLVARELRYLEDSRAGRVRTLIYQGLVPFAPEVYLRLRTMARRPDPLEPPISPRLAERTKVVERCWQRRMKLWRLARDADALHAWTFRSGTLAYFCEILHRLAARADVETRSPFSDRRVVEFFVSLPLERKIDFPVPKMVIRAGMRGVVPEGARWRVESAHPGTAFMLELAKRAEASIRKEIARSRECMAEFVNLEQLKEVYAKFEAGDRRDTVWPIWRTAVLSAWLNSGKLG